MSQVKRPISFWGSKSGFGIVEAMIAGAAISVTLLIVAKTVQNSATVQESAKLSSVRTNLASFYQVAISSADSLSQSRRDALNSSLSNCFFSKTVTNASGCPRNSTPFKLNDAQNKTLIPLVANPPISVASVNANNGVFVDDKGAICDTSVMTPPTASCHWLVSAQYLSICSGGTCNGTAFPDSFQITVYLSHFNPGATSSTATYLIKSTVSKQTFGAPAIQQACATGKYLTGIYADGSLNCQDLPQKQDPFYCTCYVPSRSPTYTASNAGYYVNPVGFPFCHRCNFRGSDITGQACSESVTTSGGTTIWVYPGTWKCKAAGTFTPPTSYTTCVNANFCGASRYYQ